MNGESGESQRRERGEEGKKVTLYCVVWYVWYGMVRYLPVCYHSLYVIYNVTGVGLIV